MRSEPNNFTSSWYAKESSIGKYQRHEAPAFIFLGKEVHFKRPEGDKLPKTHIKMHDNNETHNSSKKVRHLKQFWLAANPTGQNFEKPFNIDLQSFVLNKNLLEYVYFMEKGNYILLFFRGFFVEIL